MVKCDRAASSRPLRGREGSRTRVRRDETEEGKLEEGRDGDEICGLRRVGIETTMWLRLKLDLKLHCIAECESRRGRSVLESC